jgi:hypothetical protein
MSNKKLYTCQANKFGNIIVCGDEVERNSYTIFYTGTYADCLILKSGGRLAQNEIASLKNKAEVY